MDMIPQADNSGLVTVGRGVNQQLSGLVAAFKTVFPMSGSCGSVTLGAANSTTVANAYVKTTSRIVLTPTNAAAATLVSGAKSPYVTSKTNGTSFAIATADGNAAAGTETFDYIIVNPV